MVYEKHGFHIDDIDGVDPDEVATKVLDHIVDKDTDGIDLQELHDVIADLIMKRVGMATLTNGDKTINVSYMPYGKLSILVSI